MGEKRAYNPYRDMEAPYRAIYELPTSPEFLFSEESTKHRRSWGENLSFYTGSAYLAGAVGGGATGVLSGVRSMERGDTLKLRANRLLNSTGHSGRAFSNRLGVLGLLYAATESGIVTLADRDDVWTTLASGLATGALYRAAKGVRSAAIAGALGGLMAASARQAIKRYSPV